MRESTSQPGAVAAYISFVKTNVGITHQDELIKALEILAQKVHPLALGNVERFLAQSRMIARKLLRTHMRDEDDHKINEIVENMASKLYFHGHPINRLEAKNDLQLKVTTDSSPDIEAAIWDLYKQYEIEFDNLSAFNPTGDLANISGKQVKQKEYTLLHAMIESSRLSSRYTSERRYTEISSPAPQAGQQMLREDVLSQGWTHSSVPSDQDQHPQSRT